MEPSKYRCYYCQNENHSTLEHIVSHCVCSHGQYLLKYRELFLDELTGQFKYQTKTHEGIIPCQLIDSGKMVQVRDNLAYIVNRKSKKKRLSTPVKEKETRRPLLFDNFNGPKVAHSHDFIDDDESYVAKDITSHPCLFEMTMLLPDVLACLQKDGQLETYLKFNHLLAAGNFPTNNICYILFLDLVEWFACDNTSRMRYQPETIKFWQIGFRLFHGKFLRFMSGLRNFGQILAGVAERGVNDPMMSKLNFAVPSRNNLYQKQEIDLFYPGIRVDSIKLLAEQYGDKPMKLSVDGKKISRGKGKVIGDIDCWGFEKSPTLKERKEAHALDILFVQGVEEKLDNLEEKGLFELNNLPAATQVDIVNDLKKIAQCLAKKNELLRERTLSLEQGEAKFKKLGGEDWNHSKFYPVICSIRVNKSEMKQQVEDSEDICNKIAFYGATINGCQRNFCKLNTVVLPEQENCLRLDVEHVTDNSRYIPQRTDRWFEIRKQAMVTGSTCHKALGLGQLKQQKEHFNVFVLKNEPTTRYDDATQTRMEYGTIHEIDAVAGLAGKVLPFLYPHLLYFEEGCVKVPNGDNPSFMVVSPDGSFTESHDGPVVMMYENKCKSPTGYSSTAYHKIPQYYVTQLLSEMNAYNSYELLFTCWAEQSMTVFHVDFDQALWDSCWNELTDVYAVTDRRRPTRFSPMAKALKDCVKAFTENNVTLLDEFPACRAVMAANSDTTTEHLLPHVTPNSKSYVTAAVPLEQLRETIILIKKWLNGTYHLLRTVASEILVYMVSDLDRAYNMEIANAHPIAYASKGPSMSSDIFRNMTDEVIVKCEQNGLNIVVTSSDGQWHQYGIRDSHGRPLTVHQLHRDHWSFVKSKGKAPLLAELRGTYRVGSLDDMKLERTADSLVVHGHTTDTPMFRSVGCISDEVDDDTDVSDVVTDLIIDRNSQTENSCDLVDCLDGEFDDTIDNEVLTEINRMENDHSATQVNRHNQTEPLVDIGEWIFNEDESNNCVGSVYTETRFGTNETSDMSTHSVQFDEHETFNASVLPAEPMETNSTSSSILLGTDSYSLMLLALQRDEKSMNIHRWTDVGLLQFTSYFASPEQLNKNFQRHELSVCMKAVKVTMRSKGIVCSPNWPKYKMIDFFFQSTQRNGVSRLPISSSRKLNPPSLRKICSSAVGSLSTDTLATMVSERTWHEVFHNWQMAGPIPSGIEITDVKSNIQWFSQPCVGSDGYIRFHYTDACHILTCIRTKMCTTGIVGLRRKAWEMAAQCEQTNLNVSVVIDCVDKQDVSLARRMFAEDVEDVMMNEFPEASFCRLVREWFDAEDEPLIKAVDRCKRRLALRDWLLQGYTIGKFRPPTRYVRGIPIVTFEGLVAHTERKLQMHAFVPDNKYNARATGSQEVENFFSTLRDMDPSGKGTPKPDVIPEMMSAVAEVDNFRLNPDKPFFIKTTSSGIYPMTPFMTPSNTDQPTSRFSRLPSDAEAISFIVPRDHMFDLPERDTKKHKRRSSRISKPDEPAHGERGVRQFHARDDSKILAHHRKGLMSLPDS